METKSSGCCVKSNSRIVSRERKECTRIRGKLRQKRGGWTSRGCIKTRGFRSPGLDFNDVLGHSRCISRLLFFLFIHPLAYFFSSRPWTANSFSYFSLFHPLILFFIIPIFFFNIFHPGFSFFHITARK